MPLSTPASRLRSSPAVFLSLAGAACGITLVFLGMRAVMEIGGACADGVSPYPIARPCPSGVPAALFGGIWGGLACIGVYAVVTAARGVPGLLPFAWPALFLSLGWNFLEYGVRPPDGGGPAWAWLLSGAVFVLMGGIPLALWAGPALRRFSAPGDDAAAVREPVARPPGQSPARPAAAQGPEEDLVAHLERLAALHTAGRLNDAEYRAAKGLLLGKEGVP